jgi:methionine-rich copper-binding protein CopC
MPRLLQRFRVVPRLMAVLVAVYIVLLGLIVTIAPVQAHAAYKSSNPAANSVLKTAPTKVTITFVQRLSPQGLSIVVYDKTAKVVSTSQAQISFTDPYTASVSMRGDGSDIYRVDWNNVSAEDGDPTLGAFVFGVDPSGKTDKVPPVAAASTSASSGVPPLVAVLAGILGLLIGGAATYVTTRARPPQQR